MKSDIYTLFAGLGNFRHYPLTLDAVTSPCKSSTPILVGLESILAIVAALRKHREVFGLGYDFSKTIALPRLNFEELIRELGTIQPNLVGQELVCRANDIFTSYRVEGVTELLIASCVPENTLVMIAEGGELDRVQLKLKDAAVHRDFNLNTLFEMLQKAMAQLKLIDYFNT